MLSDIEAAARVAAASRTEQWWMALTPDSHEGAERYEPLRDELALFRSFADVPRTEQGIEAFVHAHGHLGILKFIKHAGCPQGEALADWCIEIQNMRAALDIWDALRGDPQLLDEWLSVQLDGNGGIAGVIFERWGGRGIVVSEIQRPELWQQVLDAPKSDALRLGALFFVQNAINMRLEKHVAPRLLYTPQGALELRLVPHNLLGAMWLQFGQAVEGDKDYARCVVCHRWFERSPQAKRPEAKHCSTSCRVKAYRGRQEEARRRAADGESVKAIAVDIGSDVETVRGWIKKAGIEENNEKASSRRRRRSIKGGGRRWRASTSD